MPIYQMSEGLAYGLRQIDRLFESLLNDAVVISSTATTASFQVGTATMTITGQDLVFGSTALDTTLLTGTLDSLIYTYKPGYGDDAFDAGAGDDLVHGGGGGDTIWGGTGRDKVFGGRGYDVSFGQDGRDKLFGGGQRDDLQGGRGNDKLVGGGGDDDLTGGWGADRFVFLSTNLLHEQDTIHDFKVGLDKIVIRSGSSSVTTADTDAGFDIIDGLRVIHVLCVSVGDLDSSSVMVIA
ncbi:MAG: Ca2+-binding RTX toxin-like protein [Paracoccaceae bacterium]|jgi:Ca2+-binding RTX toxin-like protein